MCLIMQFTLCYATLLLISGQGIVDFKIGVFYLRMFSKIVMRLKRHIFRRANHQQFLMQTCDSMNFTHLVTTTLSNFKLK